MAAIYLSIQLPYYDYDINTWTSIITCCSPSNVNSQTILTHCDTALLQMIGIQNNLANLDSCFPAWVSNAMLPNLMLQSADTTTAMLNNDLTGCRLKPLNTCADTLRNSCDSINSYFYVYQQFLHAEQVDGVPAVDTGLLDYGYTYLYGNFLPYNQILTQINNCNPNDTSVLTQITYSGQNINYTDSAGLLFLDFDLFATDTPQNLLFSQGNVFIQYDTTIFGTNIVNSGRITATKGQAVDSPYYNMNLSDSLPNILKIAITHTPNPSSLANLDSVNQQLCHLRINFSGFNASAVIGAFDTVAMAGRSEYKQTIYGLDFPYDIVRVSGLVGALRSNDVILYSLSLDTITATYYGSSQQLGPDTIIFDVVANGPGDELYDADPVISYNPSGFGNYVFTNHVVQCTTAADSDYLFSVEDYSSTAFHIHLDAYDDYYTPDFFADPSPIWGVGYQIIATCKLTVQNYCAGAHLSVSPGSSGWYAYENFADTSLEYDQFTVTYGAGIDTSNLTGYTGSPSITSFSPPNINAGTFDTLTINGFGFGCTNGRVFFTSVQGGPGTLTEARSQDIISWSDNQIKMIVASCQTSYDDGNIPGTGPVQVSNSSSTGTSLSTFPLNIGYAVLNDRLLSSGKAIRVGLSGQGAGAFDGLHIPYKQYTFIPDTTIISHPPALAAITHAMNDWICETGVRFIMGTALDSNLGPIHDGRSTISFNYIEDSMHVEAQTYIWYLMLVSHMQEIQ